MSILEEYYISRFLYEVRQQDKESKGAASTAV